MSGSNGFGGGQYTNGYGAGDYSNGYSRYDDRPSHAYDGPTESRSRERRAGGYGGLGNNNRDTPPAPAQQITRPAGLDRRKANRRSRDGASSRSRSRPGEGRAAKDIEDVVDHIKQDWSFMTEDECIPVQVALQLLDDSSLGLASRSGEFRETQERLHTSLKAIVNEHHQGFNSSIGTFHQIQGSILTSQKRVRTLKESLVSARGNLSTTKPELKDLFTTAQKYENMLEVLNTIEELQQLPAKFEAMISDKRFLSAVDLLQDALRLARRSDLEDIAALADLKVFLSNQDHTLTDILIEELHNHLYLKSPYCEDRWKALAKKSDVNGSNSNVVVGRKMVEYLENLDMREVKPEGTSRSPEADTFDYTRLLLEALNKLGRLDFAIDAIEQRLPVELYRVIEKSISEVEQHHPTVRHLTEPPKDILDTNSEQRHQTRSLVLNDLLRTIYARFEAIAESHRVIHDILGGIAKRDPTWDVTRLTRGFRELWKLYQSEIRTLLHDYLSSDGSSSGRGGQNVADRNIFRYQRDKTKRLFKLDWTDASSAELMNETDDLMFIFKSFVPGLVSLPIDSTRGAANMNGQESSAAGHRLLIEPSVFNMGILLPPSISFLQRLKDIVPAGSEIVISTLSSFLNDFLINVFHPQLEDTLTEFCLHSFIELDAFQADGQWSQHAQKPIFKGTIKFFSIVTTFCRMLDNLTHDQLFSHLVVSQMNLYYEKCSAWYNDLVSRSQSRPEDAKGLKAAASFAEEGSVHDMVAELRRSNVEDSGPLMEKETKLLMEVTSGDHLTDADLLADPKSMMALCLLHSSMLWLATKLNNLRHISNRAFDSSGSAEASKPQLKRTLTGLLPAHSGDDNWTVYLPLNPESASLFDKVVGSFEELAAKALQTLHLEFRCHMIREIRKSFRASHVLPMQVDDPDPSVLGLVSDLVEINEELRAHLLEPDHDFVVLGSSHLLDALLVRSTAQIQTMNAFGCERMQLNVLVLRQNLLNIDRQASLARSAAYFALFRLGDAGIIAAAKHKDGSVKRHAFTEDELKKLIELWYSEESKSALKDEATKAQRGLDDALLQLSEAMWSV